MNDLLIYSCVFSFNPVSCCLVTMGCCGTGVLMSGQRVWQQWSYLSKTFMYVKIQQYQQLWYTDVQLSGPRYRVFHCSIFCDILVCVCMRIWMFNLCARHENYRISILTISRCHNYGKHDLLQVMASITCCSWWQLQHLVHSNTPIFSINKSLLYHILDIHNLIQLNPLLIIQLPPIVLHLSTNLTEGVHTPICGVIVTLFIASTLRGGGPLINGCWVVYVHTLRLSK